MLDNIKLIQKQMYYILTTNLTASTGPIPIIRGSTPTCATATILANGEIPLLAATSWDMRITTAAPSFMPDALPAVTVPF